MKTIEMFMRSPEQVEKCRLLLLKAIDDTLRPNSRTVSLMDLIEQRMAHRAQFDKTSRELEVGPLIRPT